MEAIHATEVTPHQQLAALLCECADEIAERTVSWQMQARPALKARYGAIGVAKSIDDVRYNVRYLAEAIRNDAPQIFEQYMDWLRAVVEPYGVTATDMLQHLDLLERALREYPLAAGDELVATSFERARRVFTEPAGQPQRLLYADAPLADLAERYLAALLDADRHAAVRMITDAADGAASVLDLYLHVLQPVQYEIGRLWQVKNITVAEEHFATAVTQLVMSLLYSRIVRSPRTGRRMVAACVGSDLHEVGIRMVADVFELHGWDTYFVGARTPTRSLIDLLESRESDLLAVSTTLAVHLPDLRAVVDAVRGSKRGAIPILIGGYPFNSIPGLWKRYGADGYAPRADEAVRLADRLVSAKG